MRLEEFETLTDDEVRERAAIIPDAIYPLMNSVDVRLVVTLYEGLAERDFMLAVSAAFALDENSEHHTAMEAAGLDAFGYAVALGVPSRAFETPADMSCLPPDTFRLLKSEFADAGPRFPWLSKLRTLQGYGHRDQ